MIPLNGTPILKKLQRNQTNAYSTYGNVVEQIYQPKWQIKTGSGICGPIMEWSATTPYRRTGEYPD
jgi:hypothetical protein